MDIERVQRNANLDNSGVFNPQLIIPTTFRDCLTYEQQIVFLFRMKQNKLIEGENITLTDNGDGTVTISADGGSSSGATYELVSVTPDEGYSSAYILKNIDTGAQSGVKIQIPEAEEGVGISSITFDQEVAGGNQYDVNLTDGTSYQIVAPKGAPGTKGDPGTNGTNGTDGNDGVGISSITFDQEVAGGNQYNVNLTDGTDYQIVAPKGDTGAGIPAITPTTDQGKVLTVNSSDQAVWGAPSGGSFDYTDQYGLPSNIPQIKFGCQVTSDDLTLGIRYYVTLGPQYTPDPSGEDKPTPGSLENGKDLFDYVSDNSISAPGVVVPVNFPEFELYYYDSNEDNYMNIVQFRGGTWTATGFYVNGNAVLNIEGIFRSSDAEEFAYLSLQLKSPDGLTWTSYNSTSCYVTPLLGTFRAR